MRESKAKKLRKMAYGEKSLKAPREYKGLTRIGRVLFGDPFIWNDPKSPRGAYQRLKDKFPKGARVC